MSARDVLAGVRADLVQRAWAASVRYGAIGPNQRAARRFHAFGDGSMIAFPAERHLR